MMNQRQGLSSFPNSVWERCGEKLRFQSHPRREAELRSPAFPSGAWERGTSSSFRIHHLFLWVCLVAAAYALDALDDDALAGLDALAGPGAGQNFAQAVVNLAELHQAFFDDIVRVDAVDDLDALVGVHCAGADEDGLVRPSERQMDLGEQAGGEHALAEELAGRRQVAGDAADHSSFGEDAGAIAEAAAHAQRPG